MQETRVPSLGQGKSPREGNGTKSSILAWEILWSPKSQTRLVYWAHIHINCPTVTVHGCHCLWSLIVSLYPIAGIDICPGASTQVKGPRFQPVSPQPFSPKTGHKLSCERCPPLYQKGKSSLTVKDKSSPRRIWTNKLYSFPQFTCLPHIP